MNVREVRSEVFLRQDLQSILRAIDAANAELAHLLPQEEVALYRAGFSDALRAVATAFHATLTPGAGAEDDLPRISQFPRRRIRVLGQSAESASLDRRPEE